MAVNELSPRVKPKDEVCLCCHKSLTSSAVTVMYYIPSDWRQMQLATVTVNKETNLNGQVMASSLYLDWTDRVVVPS